ncbi:hypothetical protein Tco_1464464 [Tanacetum coccineum]
MTMPGATSSSLSPDVNLNVNPVDESNAEQQMNSEFLKLATIVSMLSYYIHYGDNSIYAKVSPSTTAS